MFLIVAVRKTITMFMLEIVHLQRKRKNFIIICRHCEKMMKQAYIISIIP